MCQTDTHAPARGLFTATILANESLCEQHYLLRLHMASFPPTQPGQFIQIQCRPPQVPQGYRQADWPAQGPPRLTGPELQDREPLLRRPISLAGRRDVSDGVELELIYRSVGAGTRWLSRAAAGNEISILGPLGNAFAVSGTKKFAAVVGGGVGIPPMIYLSRSLAAAGKSTVAFCGVRTAKLLPVTTSATPPVDGTAALCVDAFSAAGVPCAVTSDDGSIGLAGFVPQALEKWLDGANIAPADAVVYCCGPEVMMWAVGRMCLTRGIECWFSMERHMACGVGTCQSCIVKIRADNERGWEFKLCCTHGPVFNARDVMW